MAEHYAVLPLCTPQAAASTPHVPPSRSIQSADDPPATGRNQALFPARLTVGAEVYSGLTVGAGRARGFRKSPRSPDVHQTLALLSATFRAEWLAMQSRTSPTQLRYDIALPTPTSIIPVTLKNTLTV